MRISDKEGPSDLAWFMVCILILLLVFIYVAFLQDDERPCTKVPELTDANPCIQVSINGQLTQLCTGAKK